MRVVVVNFKLGVSEIHISTFKFMSLKMNVSIVSLYLQHGIKTLPRSPLLQEDYLSLQKGGRKVKQLSKVPVAAEIIAGRNIALLIGQSHHRLPQV